MHHPPRTLCHGRTCRAGCLFVRAGVCPGSAGTGDAGGTTALPPGAGRGGGEAARERCSAALGRRERFQRPPSDRQRLPCPPEAAGRLPSTAAPAAPGTRAGMLRVPHRARDPPCEAAPPVPALPSLPCIASQLPAAADTAGGSAGRRLCRCRRPRRRHRGEQSPAHSARPRREQVTSAAGWRVSPFKWMGSFPGNIPAAPRLCFCRRRWQGHTQPCAHRDVDKFWGSRGAGDVLLMRF